MSPEEIAQRLRTLSEKLYRSEITHKVWVDAIREALNAEIEECAQLAQGTDWGPSAAKRIRERKIR